MVNSIFRFSEFVSQIIYFFYTIASMFSSHSKALSGFQLVEQ